jgi:hypothetical protein
LAVDDDIGFLEDLIEDNPMDDPLWSAAVYTVIAIGAFVFLLGFLGCCGACTQNSCMLCAVSFSCSEIADYYFVFCRFQYQIIVSIVLVAEVVCVILMIVFKSDVSAEGITWFIKNEHVFSHRLVMDLKRACLIPS